MAAVRKSIGFKPSNAASQAWVVGAATLDRRNGSSSFRISFGLRGSARYSINRSLLKILKSRKYEAKWNLQLDAGNP